MHAVSHDGRWVYFVSDRSGTDEVWKALVGGGQPVKVTSDGGQMPIEAADGSLCFIPGAPLAGMPSAELARVCRIPFAGGEDRRVLRQAIGEFSWTVSEAGIYFIDNSGPRLSLKLLESATGHTITLPLERPPYWGNPEIAVSTDGRNILYSQLDTVIRDVMLGENCR